MRRTMGSFQANIIFFCLWSTALAVLPAASQHQHGLARRKNLHMDAADTVAGQHQQQAVELATLDSLTTTFHHHHRTTSDGISRISSSVKRFKNKKAKKKSSTKKSSKHKKHSYPSFRWPKMVAKGGMKMKGKGKGKEGKVKIVILGKVVAKGKGKGKGNMRMMNMMMMMMMTTASPTIHPSASSSPSPSTTTTSSSPSPSTFSSSQLPSTSPSTSEPRVFVWEKIPPILGTAVGDLAGRAVSLSVNGRVAAVGFPGGGGGTGEGRGLSFIENIGPEDEETNGDGFVRVFLLQSSGQWAQFGQDIPFSSAGAASSTSTTPALFGASLDLNSLGTQLTVGAPGYNNNTGMVAVFFHNPWTDTWVLFNSATTGSVPLVGEQPGERFGTSVAFSEQVVAVGAPGHKLNNDNGLDSVGRVAVFYYVLQEEGNGPDDFLWKRLGQDLIGDGTPNSQCGCDVSLATTSLDITVAIGCPKSDENFEDAGGVFVYQTAASFNSDWTLYGSPITGQSDGEECGFSIELSKEGNKVVFGCPRNNIRGVVRVAAFDSGSGDWQQIGNDIQGDDDNEAAVGSSVALSGDGQSVAYYKVGNTGTISFDTGVSTKATEGQVTVLELRDNQWFQVGQTLDSSNIIGDFPFSLALSFDSTSILIGAIGGTEPAGKAEGYVLVKVSPTISPAPQTPQPLRFPSAFPTNTNAPTVGPSPTPSEVPTATTEPPTAFPTMQPSTLPSNSPTSSPFGLTDIPTMTPSSSPLAAPSRNPTTGPSASLSSDPSSSPSSTPTGGSLSESPSATKTSSPTVAKYIDPTSFPSQFLTPGPTMLPPVNTPTTVQPAAPAPDPATSSPGRPSLPTPGGQTPDPSHAPSEFPTITFAPSKTIAPSSTLASSISVRPTGTNLPTITAPPSSLSPPSTPANGLNAAV